MNNHHNENIESPFTKQISENLAVPSSKRQSTVHDKENMNPSQEFVKPEIHKRQSFVPQPILEEPIEYKENRNLDLEFKRKSFTAFAYAPMETASRVNSRFSDSQVLRSCLRSTGLLNKKAEEQLPEFSESIIPPFSTSQDNFCHSQEFPETQSTLAQSTLVDSINLETPKVTNQGRKRFFVRILIGLLIGLLGAFAFSFVSGTQISSVNVPVSDPQQVRKEFFE